MSSVNHIILKCLEDGILDVRNKWMSAIVVDGEYIGKKCGTSLQVKKNQEVVIAESYPGISFRKWNKYRCALVSGVKCQVIKMPPINAFTEDADGMIAGNDFL